MSIFGKFRRKNKHTQQDHKDIESTSTLHVWGSPTTKHRDRVASSLDTNLPSNITAELVVRNYESENSPTRKNIIKRREEEAKRREQYYIYLELPGDKSSDKWWALELVRDVFYEITKKTNSPIIAYAVLESWRHLQVISAFPDDIVLQAGGRINKQYLAWSRMEEQLRDIMVPYRSLIDLVELELKRELANSRNSQSIMGETGAYIRKKTGNIINMPQIICMLAEIDNWVATIEEVFSSWKTILDSSKDKGLSS